MKRTLLALALTLVGAFAAVAQQSNPLPSWSDGPSKRAIISFVEAVTKPGSTDFVPPAERIATFDNDGCLWVEQPIYTQAFFIVDRMKALAPSRPEWKSNTLFSAVIEKGLAGLSGVSEHDLAELVAATHGGMTPADFRALVSDWLATARHPRFNRPFTELVYQPMLEILDYLRANGFKTYIVSGGGVEFVRAYAERVYGIPPEQVIGSRAKVAFETKDGRATLTRQGSIEFIDDKAGKAIAIEHIIGRRPLAAFGNSDGDLEMLQWTTQAGGRRLGMIVHHTDDVREYAYDRESSVGRLARALDQAPKEGWTIVDMKSEWNVVFK
ncbi:MAG: HAD family hydrolase [Beijerinckiaceae bacterium]|nr:HAD family hydrolase [Beijerinckiaceae bacterium]